MKRKMYILIGFIVLFLLLALFTNPNEETYAQYSEVQTETQIPPEVKIERINFYVFSTYTPITKLEYGTTHLGIFNNFFKISEGQFDYPKWLEFFK